MILATLWKEGCEFAVRLVFFSQNLCARFWNLRLRKKLRAWNSQSALNKRPERNSINCKHIVFHNLYGRDCEIVTFVIKYLIKYNIVTIIIRKSISENLRVHIWSKSALKNVLRNLIISIDVKTTEWLFESLRFEEKEILKVKEGYKNTFTYSITSLVQWRGLWTIFFHYIRS